MHAMCKNRQASGCGSAFILVIRCEQVEQRLAEQRIMELWGCGEAEMVTRKTAGNHASHS